MNEAQAKKQYNTDEEADELLEQSHSSIKLNISILSAPTEAAEDFGENYRETIEEEESSAMYTDWIDELD